MGNTKATPKQKLKNAYETFKRSYEVNRVALFTQRDLKKTEKLLTKLEGYIK